MRSLMRSDIDIGSGWRAAAETLAEFLGLSTSWTSKQLNSWTDWDPSAFSNEEFSGITEKQLLKNISLVAEDAVYRNGHGTVKLICLFDDDDDDDDVDNTFSIQGNLSEYIPINRGMRGTTLFCFFLSPFPALVQAPVDTLGVLALRCHGRARGSWGKPKITWWSHIPLVCCPADGEALYVCAPAIRSALQESSWRQLALALLQDWIEELHAG